MIKQSNRVRKMSIAPKAKRKPLNISVREDLIEAARSLNLNTSQAAEAGIAEAVKQAQETAWLEENRDAIEAHNERVEKSGPLLRPSWLAD